VGCNGVSGVPVPRISEEDAGNLFAYFASLRYFEPMGDASRGKRAFEAKGCAGCHTQSGAQAGRAQIISKWQSTSDPISLVSAMWNHVPQMNVEMAKRRMKWPLLKSQDLSDILVYARSVSAGNPQTPIQLELPPLEGGEASLESYGCVTCHTGANVLGRQMSGRSLTDIAAEMWNHGPKMLQNRVPIPPEEMRSLLGAVWFRQFVHPQGNAARGERIAASKQCLSCHTSGPGPDFGTLDGSWSVLRLTSALWKHGPAMLSQMQSKHIQWPHFSASQIQDLIAWLGSQNRSRTASR